MGTGVIMSGRRVLLPGIDVVNFLDDPKLRLAPEDVRRRTSAEKQWLHLAVVHTTGGIPGGHDLRPQLVLPGLGPSTGGGDRIVASWTHDRDRHGGAHFVTDHDGRHYCCADLVDDASYHAGFTNGCSVGFEIVQGRGRAEIYEGQLAAAAALVVAVCAAMPTPIQLQVPRHYSGGPVPRFVAGQIRQPYLADVVGIVGHRDLTSNRGSGDPGDAAMSALVAAGCEAFDFAAREDLAAWSLRQRSLGLVPDGVPGPKTVARLLSRGYRNGLWALAPSS